MKFLVTLSNSHNVYVRTMIECIKKTNPDCTFFVGKEKFHMHKMLLQVFCDKYTNTFDDYDHPVIVLLDHSEEVVKIVILGILYKTSVVIDQENLQGVKILAEALGINIEVEHIVIPAASANQMPQKFSVVTSEKLPDVEPEDLADLVPRKRPLVLEKKLPTLESIPPIKIKRTASLPMRYKDLTSARGRVRQILERFSPTS